MAWDWPYIHFQLKLQDEPWRYWPRLNIILESALKNLGVALDGIVQPVKKRGIEKLSYKTMCLLVFMVTHASQKQCRSKEAEMHLVGKFALFAALGCGGKSVKADDMLLKFNMEVLGHGQCNVCLVMTPTRHLIGMPQQVLNLLPMLKGMWDRVKDRALMGIACSNISSNIAQPLIEDWLFFLMFLDKNNPELRDVFVTSAMRACLLCISKMLEGYVIDNVVAARTEPSMALPILKGKKGKARNTDPAARKAWMNKMLLTKFTINKFTQALTRDILPKGVQDNFEHASVVAYLKKLKTAFKDVKRVHLSMDESNHTESTLVTAVYSPQNNMAAYAPIVAMQKATFRDLDLPELKELAAEAKLVRMAAFTYIKALHQVLQSWGHDLDTYKLPPEVIARPLKSHEMRIQDEVTKKWVIHDTIAGTCCFQVPHNFQWNNVPLLMVCIDQAQTGLASNQFLMDKIGLVMLQTGDKFHRVCTLETQAS